MRIPGLNIQISRAAPRVKVTGSNFSERTLLNQVVLAKAPNLPPKNWTVDTQVLALPPFGINPPRPTLGTVSSDLVDRSIHNDPRELWYLALPNKLTPQQCLTILRSALGGDIWQQWQLLSLMLDTWPTFRMAAHQLREAVSYVKYNVHPYAEDGEEPTESAKEKASLVSRAFRSMVPNPFNDERNFSGMVYDFTDAMLNGLSMQELLWQEVTSKQHGKERMPRSSAWVHPRHFTFTNDGFIAVFDDSYSRLYANPSLGGKIGTSPDPNKFICSQFISRSGSSLGAGFMRPLVWYWAARQFNQEWMLNTAKQYGSPFIDITYVNKDDITKLEEMLKTAGPNRRLLHPEGTTAEIHQPSSLGKENPQRYLCEEADKACLFLLLGQSATTMPTPGKLGNSDTHQDIKQERIAALAQWAANNPINQLARAVVRVNYGEETEVPDVQPDFTKPLDALAVGTFITAVSTSQVPLRADEVYEKVGMTQPDEGDMVLVGGKLVFLSEIKTQEELQQAQDDKDMAQLQAKGLNQEETTPPDSIPTKAVMKRAIVKRLRGASTEDLYELENLVQAAERAPHLNGEYGTLKKKLLSLPNRK